MKKGTRFIICLSLVLIFSLSYISAGFFSDFFDGITGRVTGEVSCTDSDDNLNLIESYYTKGNIIWYPNGIEKEDYDYCTNNYDAPKLDVRDEGMYLVEVYCLDDYYSGAFHIYECPNGCEDGACIGTYEKSDDSTSTPCVDSDGGINLYEKGHTVGINPHASLEYQNADSWDTCKDGKFIFEFHCQDNLFYSGIYECPDDLICDDGACVEGICVPQICLDLNKDCGIWEDGCGGNLDCGSCKDGEECRRGTCEVEKETYCIDADAHLSLVESYYIRENVSLLGVSTNYEPKVITDVCSTREPGKLIEGICNNISSDLSVYDQSVYRCPNGCEDGACVQIDKKVDNLSILVSTLKNSYSIGEQINLTNSLVATLNTPSITGNAINNLEENSQEITGDYSTMESVIRVYPGLISTDFNGYIIELEEEPILVKEKKLNIKAEKNDDSVLMKAVAVVLPKAIEPTLSSNIEYKIDRSKEKIKTEKEKFKEDVLRKLGKKQVITGNAIAGATEEDLAVMNEYEDVFNAVVMDISEEDAEKIKEIRGVKRVYPNYPVNATLMDSVDLIGASDVWQLNASLDSCSGEDCLTGKGITIGIIDTGVDYTHADLGECFGGECKVVGGYDFVNNDDDPMDDQGHGTHCAATATGNGALKGVAPDAEVYAYKVLDSRGSGYMDDVIAAIERSVDPNQDGDFSDHLDIISLSLGGGGSPDDPSSQAIDNVVEAGVVAVIAAGNSGPGEQTIGSPGTSRKAITVGASDKFNNIAIFSSRGPVIWEDENGEEKTLIKPDIVAPGVDICAAQWDVAWSDSECLDTEHTAISGTSMATPHVAGAVALLKQKNPDWSPEEVKSVLKSTTVDLGEGAIVQGQGRMDILEAVSLDNDPLIVELNDMNYVVSGKINIFGTVKGEDFLGISVYYSKRESDDWSLICSVDSMIDNGVLCSNFDTTILNDGEYLLKLEATDNYGNVYRDYSMILFKNINFIGMGYNLNYLKNVEDVRGVVNIPDYSAYRIEYQTELDYNEGAYLWTEACSGEHPLSEEVLCILDMSSFNNGVYYFRISVSVNDINWVSSQVIGAIVFKEMLDGWPVEINGSESGFINIGKDSEGINLIIPHHKHCEPPLYRSCSDSGLYIYNSEGQEVKFIQNISDYKVPNEKVPAIYNIGQKEYVAMIGSSRTIYEGMGILGFDGDLIYKWPGEDYEPNKYIAPLIVIDDMLFNLRLNRLSGEMSIEGFNKEGQPFNNFPISIEKEGLREKSIISDFPIVFTDKNGIKNIGITAGNYNVDEDGYIRDLILFFDIYSLNGSLIKRTVFFEESLPLLSFQLSIPVVGDMNKDDNAEIISNVLVVYENLYNAGLYDDAYKNNFFIFNNSGAIVSRINSIKGYTSSNKIILADLDRRGNLSVIAILDGAGNDKIISFDVNGNIIFNESIEDYSNCRYGGLVAGNIDSENTPEIIVGYSSADYGGNSGFKIFDNNGILKEDIKFPAIGNRINSFNTDPILTDFNNDGILDLIQQSNYFGDDNLFKTRLYAFSLGALYNPDLIDWPMFRHDPQHTGCYDCNFQLSLVPAIESPQSKITNNASINIAGNLTMKLQKFNDISSVWIDEQIVVNSKQINIIANDYYDLASDWNSQDVVASSVGDYRVYISFDYEGDSIEASWEFIVQ